MVQVLSSTDFWAYFDVFSISSYCSNVNIIPERMLKFVFLFCSYIIITRKMEGNVLKDFGNRLRKLREEAGLTPGTDCQGNQLQS